MNLQPTNFSNTANKLDQAFITLAKKRFSVIILSLIVGTSNANAAVQTSSQLFVDPWSVYLQTYDRDYLYPTGTGPFAGNYIEWNGQIDKIGILPMIKPFNSLDPAGYPSGFSFSYDDYLYRTVNNPGDDVSNADYWVDLDNGIAKATFNKVGIYHAVLSRTNGTIETRAVLVNSGTLGIDKRSSASVPISGPVADFVIVSKPTAPDRTLDIATANAVNDNPGRVVRASSVSEAVKEIKKAYLENGNNKFHLEIVAHGAPGYLELGDTKIGTGGSISIKEFQELIDSYVNEISIYACSFADDGKVALQTLADSIGIAVGFDKPVSVYRNWFGLSRGWDLSLQGKKLSVPGPLPILSVLGAFGWSRRLRVRIKASSQ